MRRARDFSDAENNLMAVYFSAVDGIIKLMSPDNVEFMDNEDKKEVLREIQNLIHLLRNSYELDI
jgi:ADP-dependent phosphofructokinase/glucokinase